jgi:hypothetical protein
VIVVALLQVPDEAWHLSWKDKLLTDLEGIDTTIESAHVYPIDEFAERIDSNGISNLVSDELGF